MVLSNLFPRRERTPRPKPFEIPDEPSAAERAALRQAARRTFRLYCFACGRASEGLLVAPSGPSRCANCGGTMLFEVSPD